MRIRAALLTVVLSLLPFAAEAQDAKATLEAASKALGTADVKSIEMQGSGVMFLVGQSLSCRASRGRCSMCGPSPAS